MPREIVRISNFAPMLKNTEVSDCLKFYALKLNKRIHMYNNDNGKLKEYFDYLPKVNIEEGVKRQIEWYLGIKNRM